MGEIFKGDKGTNTSAFQSIIVLADLVGKIKSLLVNKFFIFAPSKKLINYFLRRIL